MFKSAATIVQKKEERFLCFLDGKAQTRIAFRALHAGRESAAPRFLRAQMPEITLTETAAMAQLISSRGTKAGCSNAVVGPLISGNLPVRRKG